jgi:5-formyltetrahydrofolate cyclo-ligase
MLPMLPNSPEWDKKADKKALRAQLQRERQALPDRLDRAARLQEVLRVWLVSRPELTIGA